MRRTPSLEELDAIVERGKMLYETTLRSVVETETNIGKFISIDVGSADYEIGDDLISTGDKLYARRPNAQLYGAKIGYNAAFAVGGTLTRTSHK